MSVSDDDREPIYRMQMARLRETCRHPFWYRRSVIAEGCPTRPITVPETLAVTHDECARCGAWLSLGPSNDAPEAVLIEIRAAEIATDVARNVGLGGHSPSHNTGEHCWHWFEDPFSGDAGPCCYCGHDAVVLPGIENECQAGYLARCIVEHGT